MSHYWFRLRTSYGTVEGFRVAADPAAIAEWLRSTYLVPDTGDCHLVVAGSVEHCGPVVLFESRNPLLTSLPPGA